MSRLSLILGSFVLASVLSGCGGSSGPPAETDPELSETVEPTSITLRFSEGGPLVRMGRLVIPAGDVLLVESEPEEEAFVFVSEGELEGHPAGSVLRIRGVYQVAALTETTLVGALVRATDVQPHIPAPHGVSVVRLEDSPVLLSAGGKLRVQILHDAASGASFGALSLLDADADLSVPEHVHESSVEALYILSGDGAMILGEERTLVVPGRVIYVPANTNHGYEAWTEPLRALQIYAPAGPEQRFRGLVPGTEDVAVDGP